MSNEVLIALISAGGAIITAVFAPKVKEAIANKTQKPADRFEGMFNGYERLIKHQQFELDRKTQRISDLEKNNEWQDQEIERLKTELEKMKEQNALLLRQLEAMRLEYNSDNMVT